MMPQPDFLDAPPDGDALTDYDRAHLKLYIRLLDAEAAGASWERAAAVLFDLDPLCEPERARRVYDAHLARAHWMTHTGYRHLLD
ncbi:DNA -binding domain-containing protein [Sphingomonas sanguinis]